MKTDYFSLVASQAQCSLEAARLMKEILYGYAPATIVERMTQVHHIEHEADEIRHEVIKHLSKDFITPIPQEDLMELTRLMDDVTDAIDEVVINLYMYAVRALPEDTLRLSDVALQCVEALHKAVGEFKNYKKPETLVKLLIEVNSAESEADAVYKEAMHRLFAGESDARTVIGLKAVYDGLESCCDLCEHAADVMEGVMMNNL